MNNQLEITTGFIYKIKRLFRSLFNKKHEESNNIKSLEIKGTSGADFRNSLKENESKDLIIQSLLLGKIGPSELTESQTDEMIEYFTKDIEEKRKEIENIKKHIIEMRKELIDG